MKIFMDTANVDEIREFADMGIVYGVTLKVLQQAHVRLISAE